MKLKFTVLVRLVKPVGNWHDREDNDTFIVDSANNKVIELESQGKDTVINFVDYALGDALRKLNTKGATAKSSSSNDLSN